MDSKSTDKADKAKKRELDRELDDELEDSFPASDPPALTQPVPDDDKAPAKAKRGAKLDNPRRMGG